MSHCCSAPVQTISLPKDDHRRLPVAIIGGGPVGLAAAAHLVARGESFILFEAAVRIAGNISQWKHVRLFSPWRFNIDKAARKLLEVQGWQAPNESDHPTGHDLIESYLNPLSELPAIRPHVYLDSRVVAVSRKGLSKVKTSGRENLPFALHVEQGGKRAVYEAKAVIDASGTWSSPNPANSEGVWSADEIALKNRIAYGIPDVLGDARDKYAGKHVLVAGSGHSAIHALLDLEQLTRESPSTRISWVIRKPDAREAYGGQENDSLRERGALGTRLQKLVESGAVAIYAGYRIQRFENRDGSITVIGQKDGTAWRIEGVEEIISNTGSRPDMDFLREVRTSLDPALESVDALGPLIDPNIHSCGTVRPHGEKELRQPEKDFYIVGSKSYGRAPTFLLATGYEQARSIVAALSGDWDSAAKVELELPETGVCGSGNSEDGDPCCGGPAPVGTNSCCAADANAKASGQAGCGCHS